MNRLPAPLRCFSWWFLVVWLFVFGVALWLGLQVPRSPSPHPADITLIFHTFTPEGAPIKAYLVQVGSQPWEPVATGTGCQLTRPVGTTMELTFSRDRRLSGNDTQIRVTWMETKQFMQWLKERFPAENNLTPSASKIIIEQMLRGTRGNKQYYPVVLQP